MIETGQSWKTAALRSSYCVRLFNYLEVKVIVCMKNI